MGLTILLYNKKGVAFCIIIIIEFSIVAVIENPEEVKKPLLTFLFLCLVFSFRKFHTMILHYYQKWDKFY
jgi:hypothetical protein